MKKLLCLGLLLSQAAFGFATRTNFIEETLAQRFTYEFEDLVVVDGFTPSPQFQKDINERVFEDNKVELFTVSFKSDGERLKCGAAFIKESVKFSVSNIPAEYRDRAGLVLVADCVFNEEYPIYFLVERYQVYPLDQTIHLDDQSPIDSYRFYQKVNQSRPKLLCTDNDMNSEGIPRAQFAMNELEDRVSLYTGVSRSSPAREVDGEVIWSDDRALSIGEVDQGTVPEVKATLDFVSLVLKGRMLFSFHKDNCISAEQDGLMVKSCVNTINPKRAPTWQPDADYSEVPLTFTEVRVTTQSRKVKRLILGPNGANTIIEDTDWEVIFLFKFSSENGPRYLSATQKFRDTDLEVRPECIFNPKSND